MSNCDPHFVYLLRSSNKKWVKVGRSRTIRTLDTRIKSLRGGLPFDSQLAGVSSITTEKQAHSDLQSFKIRAEWYRWTKEVRSYASRVCNLFWIERDSEDGWDEIFLADERERDKQKTEEISRQVWDAYNRGQEAIILSASQAAQVLSISPRTLWKLVHREHNPVPHVRIGRRVLFDKDALKDWSRKMTSKV